MSAALSLEGRTLVIETASEACSVALFEGDERLAHDHRVLGRGHAERLVPIIADLPGRGQAQRILVSLGPGSFTGVRIGIAAARALGVAWQAKVLGYPTLALIAAQAAAASVQSAVTVCMNGGHGEWFVQNFSDGKGEAPQQSLGPGVARAWGAHRVVAGNRATDLAQLLEGERVVLDMLPDAGQISQLDPAHLTADLSPIYGRPPDAQPLDRAPATQVGT
ncbi:tRNA (adenosine(37)-N6)-threonylcarbamoyltransferase complex dimerization subunit type 1 TsaB [Erythrobacter sp.]|jgi:tRNA threonylcarbamoyl adenosine modification protein YeaZ|uniref:tRNA (adenosine(37)-N6)-threonylcarbamoyltransferase complex dimerization subunit type 1 TsaB n=1 Tax=Erythrobacter sp. TaxID=1042 RepID=UPI002EC8242A|nr:tRNA (adenosine(37)-N6)-threonylcarbamoyltransferase complex dimerization subunit type 1 TsaB [Erythrobacter sp.]